MKSRTIITTLLLGISLSLSAQINVLPSLKFFASFNAGTTKPVAKTDKSPIFALPNQKANWAFFNNKTCKVFAELGNLGEDFWVEENPFTAVTGYKSSNIVGKGSKYRATAYCSQLADFQRLFGQEPRFVGK